MKVPLQRFLLWTQRTLFAAALAALGYCAFVIADTWTFERAESQQLDQMLEQRPTSAVGAALPTGPQPEPAADGLIGRIEIPRLAVSVMVMEGTTSKTLRRAAGHIAGTALPGQPGNAGISAHRDTFFRPLRNVRQDDIITLTTPAGEYRYRVASMKTVTPDDMSVLADSSTEVLTLVTCYPFYYVGAAPERFIVRAERVMANE